MTPIQTRAQRRKKIEHKSTTAASEGTMQSAAPPTTNVTHLTTMTEPPAGTEVVAETNPENPTTVMLSANTAVTAVSSMSY